MTRLTLQEKTDLLARMCHYIPYAHHLGIHLVSVDGDEVTLCLPYRDELVGNPDNGALAPCCCLLNRRRSAIDVPILEHVERCRWHPPRPRNDDVAPGTIAA